jgi:hypothetical protein
MPTSPPFRVSLEAEEYLKRVAVFPDKEVGISLASRITICNHAGEVTDCYDGPHFTVGWHPPGVWSGVRVEIVGREFWMVPATVEALRGKTLTLMHRYEGERQRGRIRDLLVAD